MKHWGVIIGVAALAAASPAARASTPPAAAALKSCAHGVAVFEGRIAPLAGAAKAQMRFTLQARTPDEPQWAAVATPDWGAWITAPRGSRYTYDRRVEKLVAPADYRAVIAFRWRDASGRIVRRARVTSRACHQPDPRPDLAVAQLQAGERFDATIVNRGRGAAGPFRVAFTRNGQPLGSVSVDGLAGRARTHAVLTGVPACSLGDEISAQVDADDVIDELDEDANVLSVTCGSGPGVGL